MRCFVAIEVPEDVKKEISKASEKLKKSGFVNGSFVDKKNLHLTLKFLADLSEEQVELVKKEMSEIKFKKFECSTGKTGTFPNGEYVKVIWLELVADEIMHLKGLIDNKLAGIVKGEEKEFNSHITFVRVKEAKDKPKFLDLLKEIGVKKMKFPVEKFSLIKSELTRDGPIYRTLAEFKLS